MFVCLSLLKLYTGFAVFHDTIFKIVRSTRDNFPDFHSYIALYWAPIVFISIHPPIESYRLKITKKNWISIESNPLYALAMPMTPQPRRAPALPVVLLNSCPPKPKSSMSACTTTVRPKMLLAPANEIKLSVISILATPDASAWTLPKSPTWRSAEFGAPCSLPVGLKCGPADVHPLVLSPNSWMWKPCWPGAKPVTSPVTFTGPEPIWKESTEKQKKNRWEISLFSSFCLQEYDR